MTCFVFFQLAAAVPQFQPMMKLAMDGCSQICIIMKQMLQQQSNSLVARAAPALVKRETELNLDDNDEDELLYN